MTTESVSILEVACVYQVCAGYTIGTRTAIANISSCVVLTAMFLSKLCPSSTIYKTLWYTVVKKMQVYLCHLQGFFLKNLKFNC